MKRSCRNCNRKTMVLKETWANGRIRGWECSRCHVRECEGDAYVKGREWPKASKWMREGNGLRRSRTKRKGKSRRR